MKFYTLKNIRDSLSVTRSRRRKHNANAKKNVFRRKSNRRRV
jgi:hypothetical protein